MATPRLSSSISVAVLRRDCRGLLLKKLDKDSFAYGTENLAVGKLLFSECAATASGQRLRRWCRSLAIEIQYLVSR